MVVMTYGLAQCRVQPHRDLFEPVLLMRKTNKLSKLVFIAFSKVTRKSHTSSFQIRPLSIQVEINNDIIDQSINERPLLVSSKITKHFGFQEINCSD